jgi:uroporphyrin-III C-methyltransferase
MRGAAQGRRSLHFRARRRRGAWLRERGVEVELVNGITAGLAGATQCDIPLTLRGVARGVTLVTAHTQDDSQLNWQALAQGGTTLVIYMGVAKLGEIREQLLAGGMATDMPVAMIENASLPHQRECRSDLMAMEEDACALSSRARPFWSSARGGLCNASQWERLARDGGRSKRLICRLPLLHQIAGKEKPGLSRAFLELQLIT